MSILRSIIWRFGLAAALSSVVLGGILGVASIMRSTETARDTAGHVLTVVIEERADDLGGYLYLTERAAIRMAARTETITGLYEMRDAWAELGPDAASILRSLYITENPHPADERIELADAGDGSSYSEVHARIHADMRTYHREGSYYDVFLIDADGNLLYTAVKEEDFGTNLASGPLSETGLARAYRNALEINPGEIAFDDLDRYGPSGDIPAAFLATPIHGYEGTHFGVLAVQIDVEHLNRLINRPTGFGETIQSYVVGADGLLRSRPEGRELDVVLSQAVSPELAETMASAPQGITEMTDFSGTPVIAAYTHIEFHGSRWGVVASQAIDEAFASAQGLTRDLTLLALLVTGLTAIATAVYAVSESRPLKDIADAALELAAGKLDHAVPHSQKAGEIGALARAVEQVKKDAVVKLQLEKQAAESQARAASAADEAKTVFVANMSHEIRTPLNGILGMAQALSSSDLTDRQSEQLSVLLQSGTRLRELVDDVLDLSKIEAGKLDIEPQAMDLRAEIQSVADLFRTKADQKGIALEAEIDSGIPDCLVLDPLRVRQCLSNLVSNAVKFTDEGQVSLRAYGAYDTSDDGLFALRIDVSDTGSGIEADVLDSLFADYTQAVATAKNDFGGTGLGLSITRKLCQLMGGETRVSSTPGQGSTFTLDLPARIAENAGQPAEEDGLRNSDAALLANCRILLVDDVATNRIVGKHLLEPYGAAITEAENGVEALELLQRKTFDLILLDQHMPKMNGLETIQAIRSGGEAWADIPAIALSADALPETRRSLLAEGMNAFVSKPFEKAALVDTILDALEPTARSSDPASAATDAASGH